jgi:hypothetical protein
MEWSKKWDISKEELIKKGKSLARYGLYSVICGLIVVIGDANVPAQYAFLLPVAVMILTNLSHTVKLFVTDTTK